MWGKITCWWADYKAHLTSDAHIWYKKWSTWLALIWGTVVAVFWSAPDWLPELLNVMPSETRAFLSPIVLGIVAGLPILIVHLRQKKLAAAPPAAAADDAAQQ